MAIQRIRHRGEAPRDVDLGPASASAESAARHGSSGALSAVGRLSAVVPSQLRNVGTEAPVGGAGRIERSQATAAQREAWRAADEGTGPARPSSEDIPTAAPWRAEPGSLGSRQRHPAPAPSPEEPTVTEPRPPEPLEEEDTTRLIRELVLAANVADDAYLVYRNAERSSAAAEDAWLAARAALEAAMVGVRQPGAPDPMPIRPAKAVPEPGADIPRIIPERPPAAAGRPVRPALAPGQQRILEAAIKHRGDRAAAAAELGTNVGNVNAQLHAIGAKGRLPIDLIPRLPAGFAKYSGV